MLVRKAREADFHRIAELYTQLQPADPVLPEGNARTAFNEILRQPWLSLFVLEAHGRVLATCYLNVIPNVTRSGRPYGIIENVVTEQAGRGRGYGKRIMAHTLEAAWSAGCYKVMLTTGSTSDSTHSFYRACGFSGDEKRAYVARPQPALNPR